MSKFVRWLGAFGKGESLSESASWELAQVSRQVAAEPLVRGKSYIIHAKIGLSVACPEATFARGWLADAFTVEKDGLLIATRNEKHAFRNMDKFLKALNKTRGRTGHAEAIFNAPLYDAVIVKSSCTDLGKTRAERLAKSLNLPLRIL